MSHSSDSRTGWCPQRLSVHTDSLELGFGALSLSTLCVLALFLRRLLSRNAITGYGGGGEASVTAALSQRHYWLQRWRITDEHGKGAVAESVWPGTPKVGAALQDHCACTGMFRFLHRS
ncbi:hypothetical protein KC19_4G185900 [Ceratodon purpureus]|uniref:Uncharacterized protein n=1 Tax=Ceratodon purpureus TaxID=3225 RepID=A0A8T0IA23_CERPU|nr:hypothetical protein KC19_4G185900 [Ceratodon purpureus]